MYTHVRHKSATTLEVPINTITYPLLNDTSIFMRATHLTPIFAVLGQNLTIFALLGKFSQSTSVRHKSATTLEVAINTCRLRKLA